MTAGCLLAACAISAYVLFLPLETKPDLATFLLLAIGLFAAVGIKEFRPRLTRLDYVVIAAVVATTALSSLLSVDPARSARFFVYLCFNVVALVLAAAVVSRNAVRVLFAFLGLAGAVHLFALLGAVQLTGNLSPGAIVRHAHMATLVAPNDALILGLCLPFLAYFSNPGGARPVSFPSLLVVAYVVFGIYLSVRLHSKVSFLALLIAALAMLVATRFSALWEAAPARGRIALLAAGFSIITALSASAWYLGNQSTTRLSLWVQAASALDTPVEFLAGAGPNTFLYDPAAGPSAFDRGDLVVPWVHNLYLEAFHDQGVPGVVVILALTFIPIARALRVEDPAVRAVLLASMFTFVALAIFEITLTRRFYFVYLMTMYGLSAAQTRGSSP